MDINQFVINYWSHIAAQNEEELKNIFTKMPIFVGIIRMRNLMLVNFDNLAVISVN